LGKREAVADDYLHVYLNDHLAGATAVVELAERAAKNNEGTELGDFLTGLAREIDLDRDELQRLMGELDVSRNAIKAAGAYLFEKLSQMKANGQITGYSPLSRVIELEMLHMGITGKVQLWGAMREVFGPALGDFDFERLLERAKQQRDGVEERRVAAAREAFGESVQPAKAALSGVDI
jgi:hypothetical protein